MSNPSAWLLGAHALFSSEQRLYDFWIDADVTLLVEAFHAHEALSEPYHFEVLALSLDADIPLDSLLGKQAAILPLSLDGGRSRRSGYIARATREAAEGGFCRYRLHLVPGLWYTRERLDSRVFQEQPVLDIVAQVLARYGSRITIHHAPGLDAFASEARPRSYCVQYRESDYTFITRLLAEEGIGFYFDEDPACKLDDAGEAALHRLVLFSDSSGFDEDELSAELGYVRYYRAASQAQEDGIQQFSALRSLYSTHTSFASYDYKTGRIVATSMPGLPAGMDHAPAIESYDHPGAYAFANSREAERYTRLAREAVEARYKTYAGQGSVRSFRPGYAFTLSESVLELDPDSELRYALTCVEYVGFNTLPNMSSELRGAAVPAFSAQVPAEVIEAARQHGYANRFDAIRLDVPWRPMLVDDTGARFNPKPTALGPQSAIVVGPNDETTPQGSNELHTDALGRIKVRFHWQQGEHPADRSSCWVRVAQRAAGERIGTQFIPRIGHEVMVIFLDNDIDRPIVLGALYNGRGEDDAALYAKALDKRASAQGNTYAGQAPAWHAAATAHHHRGALSGFKSKEFGASGYSQLVFDDTDEQLRSQLKTTQTHAELNLGHLVHQADNHRGSFRGLGFEVRTDAYGAVRAARGVFLTTDRAANLDAGECQAATARIQSAKTLAEQYSASANVHLGITFASISGASALNQSSLCEAAAFLPALIDVNEAAVDGAKLNQAYSDTATPKPKQSHAQVAATSAALVTLNSQDALFLQADNLNVSAGETLHLSSGASTALASGAQLHVHTGQAIGMVSGVQGNNPLGLAIKAAQDPVQIQAQNATLAFEAKQDIAMKSIQADIDFAAAKSITLNTAAGAYIKLEGGNIEIHCPGKITVHASKKPFTGPVNAPYPMSPFPRGNFKYDEKFQLIDPAGTPLPNMRYELTRKDGTRMEGVSDAQAMIPLQEGFHPENIKIKLLGRAKKGST